MLKIAHVLNVTEIDGTKRASYLHIAQPVTMRTMLLAKGVASGKVSVDLVAVKHKNEKVDIAPGFVVAPDFDSYAHDHLPELKASGVEKPLPRLADILLAASAAPDADYVIYTNLDIGLYADFYLKVAGLIQAGHDAFCINRLDLPKTYDGIVIDESNFELAYFVEPVPHRGIDCFIFKSEYLPKLNLGNVYVGFPPIGQVLKTQIERCAGNFIWIKEGRFTFHLGSDEAWTRDKSGYHAANDEAARGLYSSCFPESPSTSGRSRQ